jgi:hypothetical protein
MDGNNNQVVKWNDRTCPQQAFALALLGATDRQIAEAFDVNEDTIHYWKRHKPEFLKKLNEGKLIANSAVAESFYKCATGYYYEEEKAFLDKSGKVVKTTIRRYKGPDPWAAARWMSLRVRNGEWQEIQKTEITQTNINITKVDLSIFSNEELQVMEKMGVKAIVEHSNGN